MVLTIGGNQRVHQSYLGKKLAATEYEQFKGGREVYLTAGMENQFEPAIRLIHADGNPSLELKYVSHKTDNSGNVNNTIILLRDPKYPVEVTLHYTSFMAEDILKCWTTIKHQEAKPVALHNFLPNDENFDLLLPYHVMNK